MDKAELHKELVLELNKLYTDKNADYGDSFAILRHRFPQAILIRLFDKLLRLETLLQGNNARVLDESIDDTLKDLANYCLMEIVERQIDKTPDKESFLNSYKMP